MRPLTFILLFFFVGGYAQNTIIIDSSFEEKNLLNNAAFFFDSSNNKDITSIAIKDFLPYNTSSSGIKNVKFWFLFRLENIDSKKKELFLKLKVNTITTIKLYKKGKNSIERVYSYNNSLKREVDIPITITSYETSEYLMEVFFKRSTYFPAKIVSLEKREAINTWVFATNLLFFGFSFIVLVINLLFFINTKNRFFLYYSFLFVTIFLSVIDTQGKLSGLINYPELKYFIIFILNVLLISSHIIFTSNALELHKYYPKHKVIGITLISGLVFFYLLFFITSDFLWYRFAKIIYFISILSFWFYGILLFKKLVYARLYTIAYFSLLCFEIFYILSINFGFFENFYTEQLLQLGCSIEMLVFLYAISYRHKEVEKKKGSLELSYSESLENIKQLEKDILIQKKKTLIAFEEKIEFYQKKYNLNKREVQVLRGHLKGLKNKEVAEEIHLSVASVKYYNGRLFDKTNTENKIQLINLFNELI